MLIGSVTSLLLSLATPWASSRLVTVGSGRGLGPISIGCDTIIFDSIVECEVISRCRIWAEAVIVAIEADSTFGVGRFDDIVVAIDDNIGYAIENMEGIVVAIDGDSNLRL